MRSSCTSTGSAPHRQQEEIRYESPCVPWGGGSEGYSSALWEILPFRAFTTKVFFSFVPMGLMGEIIKPLPCGLGSGGSASFTHGENSESKSSPPPLQVREFSLSLSFFSPLSTGESREFISSSRQRGEPNQPRLSIMQGAARPPPPPRPSPLNPAPI